MVTGTSDDDQPLVVRSRFSRRRRIALAVALVLIVALAGLWLARKPIAEGFIDRTLTKAGVPARYGIADLGLGRQRLTNVVIGNPRSPDLTADWIETRTTIGRDGPTLSGVRAGHVRVRGRLVDGKLSLGAIDRLLPAPSGKPFALPAIDLDIADGRMRLETPYGVVGLKLSGDGRLDNGFSGRLAAISERIDAGGCVAERLATTMRVTVKTEAPTLVGPVRVSSLACAGTKVARLATDMDVTLSAALDHATGKVRLATGAVTNPAGTASGVGGSIDFAGGVTALAGSMNMVARGVATPQGRARSVAVIGDYRFGGVSTFGGRVQMGGASLPPARVADWTGWRASADGTPFGPLAEALGAGIAGLARDFAAEASFGIRRSRDGRGIARVSRLTVAGGGGARLALGGGTGVEIGLVSGETRVDTAVATSGGGLPAARLTLRQDAPGGSIRGRASMTPYAAGGASLALTPVDFVAGARGATTISTRVTLSGPLGDGRIEGLTVPIEARWNGGGGLILNPDCAPLAWERLAVSGLSLDRTATRLCPAGGAMAILDRGRLSGGISMGKIALVGRIGATPLSLASEGATLTLADRHFTMTGVTTRLGAADRITRLDAATLDGTIEGVGVAGGFAGAGGQIGNVPLLLSGAEGRWRFAGGALSLQGGLTVADAAATPRFNQLAGRDVVLTLVHGAIHATGTLTEPTTQTRVADVTLDHDLSRGQGQATLRVASLAFTEAFQPQLLTPVTFGVIADVRGTIAGEGHIGWTPDGVTSTGDFHTGDMDLAAAFGPVTGIAGTIHFTDLLGLQSAPGQVVTIRTLNPGIPVTDGTIRYRTYPNARVQVEGGRWPFAGGTLTLDPTLLDFSQPAERRMTFRVDGAAADQFLQQFDFKNLDATGVFDGALPMIFDEKGGRIEGGRLTVRKGGGGIAYVGDLSQKDLGLWGNIAFQALKSLRYRSLTIVMNGPLAGEMVTEVKFAGVSQGQGAKSNFLIRRLQKLPFVFNIKIKAPFRGLLDSAQSFYDPKRLIQRNLTQLIEEQNKQAAPPDAKSSIQPPASETVP